MNTPDSQFLRTVSPFPQTDVQSVALYNPSSPASGLHLFSHHFPGDSRIEDIPVSSSDFFVPHETGIVGKGACSTATCSHVRSGSDCREENPTLSVTSLLSPTVSSACSSCTLKTAFQSGSQSAEQISFIQPPTRRNSVAPSLNQWRETRDPLTGVTVYVHNATGNCIREKPARPSPASVSSSDNHISISFGQRPHKAALHLTHDVSHLLPLPKNPAFVPVVAEPKPVMSTGIDWDSDMVNCGKDNSFVSELVRGSASKWRDMSELRQVLSESGGEEQSSVGEGGKGLGGEIEALFSSWQNPAFAAGDRVSLVLICTLIIDSIMYLYTCRRY